MATKYEKLRTEANKMLEKCKKNGVDWWVHHKKSLVDGLGQDYVDKLVMTMEDLRNNKIVTSKSWQLKIQDANDSEGINSMTMVDPSHMDRDECFIHLCRVFGEKRIISYKENKRL